MRVIIICGVDSTGMGGAPKSTLDLAIALRALDHEVVLAGDYSKSVVDKKRIISSGIKYFEESMKGLLNFPLKKLRKLVLSFRPDVVVSTHRGCDIMTSLSLKGLNVPQCSVVRMLPSKGTEKKYLTDVLRNKLWHSTLRTMRFVIGISDHVVNQLVTIIGIDPTNTLRIYNAVDTEYFKPASHDRRIRFRQEWRIPNDTYVLLDAGRLEAVKRPWDAIRIIELLRELPIVLALAGDGSYRGEIKKLLQEKGIEDKVIFLGNQMDMPFIYGGSDILLHVGQDEAFGRVIIESYSCGKPVVGVNSGGIIELVDHGRTGFLFDPGDFKKAVEYIERLISDPTLYKTMSLNARDYAIKEFSIAKLGQYYERVLTSILL